MTIPDRLYTTTGEAYRTGFAAGRVDGARNEERKRAWVKGEYARLCAELADLKVKLFAVKAAEEDVWFWQTGAAGADDNNQVDTISCPIVMWPETLIAIREQSFQEGRAESKTRAHEEGDELKQARVDLDTALTQRDEARDARDAAIVDFVRERAESKRLKAALATFMPAELTDWRAPEAVEEHAKAIVAGFVHLGYRILFNADVSPHEPAHPGLKLQDVASRFAAQVLFPSNDLIRNGTRRISADEALVKGLWAEVNPPGVPPLSFDAFRAWLTALEITMEGLL